MSGMVGSARGWQDVASPDTSVPLSGLAHMNGELFATLAAGGTVAALLAGGRDSTVRQVANVTS